VIYYFKAKINENEVNRTFEYRVVMYLFVKIRERNVISSFYSAIIYPSIPKIISLFITIFVKWREICFVFRRCENNRVD
jgi:hypothetical protein